MFRKTGVAVVLALALVAAGVAASTARSTATTTRTLVTLHKAGKLGKVLASSRGMTLYMYTPDHKNKSVCYSGCDSTWPPLIAKGKPKAGTGVKQTLLGTTKRKNGKLQVTYKGHPLYRYVGDSKAGEANGQGYGGIWYALKASGSKASASSGGGTTTGSTWG